jgi:hypothetical protein
MGNGDFLLGLQLESAKKQEGLNKQAKISGSCIHVWRFSSLDALLWE